MEYGVEMLDGHEEYMLITQEEMFGADGDEELDPEDIDEWDDLDWEEED